MNWARLDWRCKLTAIGLERVRITKEESFNVNDMAREWRE
jgi:hypothetical protein